MWLCFYSGKRFEATFENAQWRKVKQMQPMRLCLLSGKWFEEKFKDAQWKKVKQIQPMRLCLLSGKWFEETFKDAQWRKVKHTQLMRLCHVIWIYIWKHWRKVDKMQPMWLCFQADNLKKHSGGFLQPSQSRHTCPSVKCTNTALQVYYNHLRPAILGGTSMYK